MSLWKLKWRNSLSLATYFRDYCENVLPFDYSEFEKWDNRLKEITKKLNKKYYSDENIEDLEVENRYVVGSVGRGTAVSKTSDFDCIFKLPQDVFVRFDNRSNNGQSELLQEVREVVKSRYGLTDIKGDGQVVSIQFKASPKGVIELVPAFEQKNGDFKYPCSHNGGSWKITKPTPEINECKRLDNDTEGHFINFCRLLRQWKNNNGIVFKGLLIDTLVSEYFQLEVKYQLNYTDYEKHVPKLFKFLSEQDSAKKYWFALGSNQIILNDDNGKFIKKAEKVYDLLVNSNNLIEDYRKVFGNKFATSVSSEQNSKLSNEQFIEDMFPIQISYEIKLDCYITQKGFQKHSLREFLKKKLKVKIRKNLDFFISSINIPKELKGVKYFWKVRNVGEEAVRRNCQRGQIQKGGSEKYETSEFSGPHYVECYAVYEDVVIARDRINVPIV